jgi:hypothetical protein
MQKGHFQALKFIVPMAYKILASKAWHAHYTLSSESRVQTLPFLQGNTAAAELHEHGLRPQGPQKSLPVANLFYL